MAGTYPENAGINRGSTRSWRRRRPLPRKSGDQLPRLGNPNVTLNSARQARRTTGSRAGTDLPCPAPAGINRGTGSLHSGYQPMDEAKTPLPQHRGSTRRHTSRNDARPPQRTRGSTRIRRWTGAGRTPRHERGNQPGPPGRQSREPSGYSRARGDQPPAWRAPHPVSASPANAGKQHHATAMANRGPRRAKPAD